MWHCCSFPAVLVAVLVSRIPLNGTNYAWRASERIEVQAGNVKFDMSWTCGGPLSSRGGMGSDSVVNIDRCVVPYELNLCELH